MYIKVLQIDRDCYFAYFRHHAVNSYATWQHFTGFELDKKDLILQLNASSHLYIILYA